MIKSKAAQRFEQIAAKYKLRVYHVSENEVDFETTRVPGEIDLLTLKDLCWDMILLGYILDHIWADDLFRLHIVYRRVRRQ